MAKKVLIIVPAFNEEKSLGTVLSSIKDEAPYADIVVINDGSHDATADVAGRSGVAVISVPYNLGIGGAVQTGLIYAHRKGYDVAIQLDADGQHKAEELEKLLYYLDNDEADLALGSRFLQKTDYQSTFMRKLGNRIFSGLIAMVTKQYFADSTSGFRAFNRRAINFLSEHYPTEFPEPESLVLLKKHGFRIKEVSVEMDERQAGESSVTRFKAIYFMISISIAILIDWIKKPVYVREYND
ncbi:MAG: glycosyltransferase family 2 protein [Calditrichaeota bacterium]|nr:glycosyltransferase family 2 protein [Calditrichota bacterium]